MSLFQFRDRIEEPALRAYLSRAVSAADIINSDTMNDDIRMLAKIGAKFIGRAANEWEPEPDADEHYRKTAVFADAMHAADPEAIVQACLFEAVYPAVEKISIPDWVFTAFDLPAERRHFRFADIVFMEKAPGLHWEDGGAIPDLTRLETRLWFYYKARRYIESGCEALHMGQVHLYATADLGYRLLSDLIQRIRSFARTSSRRGLVLLDAHTHGIVKNGHLLFDSHAMPLSSVPLPDAPERVVLIREGRSEGGISPSGWACESLPTLLEFDNWGGTGYPNFAFMSSAERSRLDWWGYDQIAWFAHQNRSERDRMLRHAFRWTAATDASAYCQMPARRSLGVLPIDPERIGSTLKKPIAFYKANARGEACPDGFDQEETIAELWKQGDADFRSDSAPAPAESPRESDPTGVLYPDRVVAFGDFQRLVGGRNYDSCSELTRLHRVRGGVYELSIVLPFAGKYRCGVAIGGTLSQVYSVDSYARSGIGTLLDIDVERDNSAVQFHFDMDQKKLDVAIKT